MNKIEKLNDKCERNGHYVHERERTKYRHLNK